MHNAIPVGTILNKRFEVIAGPFYKNRHEHYRLKCLACSATRESFYYNLAGRNLTCVVCRRSAAGITYDPTHPHYRIYRIWAGVKSRCLNQKCHNYRYYGANGVKICEAWRYSFPSFLEWSVSHAYSDGLILDRIDTEGDYSPDNCRWVTYAESNVNKRRTVILTAFGESKPLSKWVDDHRCRCSEAALRCRVKNGWDHEFAISKPSPAAGKKYAKKYKRRERVHSTAKLTEDGVRKVLRRLAGGELQADVAAAVGLHPITIGKIWRGQSWRHIDRSFLIGSSAE